MRVFVGVRLCVYVYVCMCECLCETCNDVYD